MPKTYQTKLDRVFAALSDPTRRSILERLKEREYSVMQLAEYYDMSFQAVSKHIMSLEKADLLIRRKEGKSYIFSFNSSPLDDAWIWITRNNSFWQHNFDALQNFLDQTHLKNITDT